MSIRVQVWDKAKASKEILKRLQTAVTERLPQEGVWKKNERVVFSSSSAQTSMGNNVDFSVTDALRMGIDQSNSDSNAAYVFKNLRFIHAQMSANPPTVAMRPTSSDQDDHRKADAADRITRWAMRHYQLQEKQDQMNLYALTYGSGFMKTVWDSSRGDIIKADMESGELTLEGDIAITNPFIWNMYIDPDAKCWAECKWVVERIYMDYDEACAQWPNKQDELKQAKVMSDGQNTSADLNSSQLRDRHYNSIELLEYWETGLPSNGYLGRYCIITRDGSVIEDPRPSPFRFRRAGAVSGIERSDEPDEVKEIRIRSLPEQASLPYHLLTDIDVPNMIWGKSAVEYAANLQDNLSRLDSARLDNIQAHGVARMIVPESCDVNVDSLSDSPWDVTKMTGAQPPFYMQAPTLMPEMSSERNNFIQGINDIMGVNEAMLGQQSRETSGASMQYATNQGNMIRRRLFNKYVGSVESVYKAILNLVRKHWSINRTIHVIGKEKALEAIDIKGADIDGGYDVVGEYGVTLSLDPVTRREEILSLQPLFKAAGIPERQLMKMMKLNELESAFDQLDLAENRQNEVFEEMISSGRYVPPEDLMDHENMIAWALGYFMTQEFTVLPNEAKLHLKQHIRDRIAMAAQEKSGGVSQPPAAPGPVPGQPAGPVPVPAGAPAPAGAPVPLPQ